MHIEYKKIKTQCFSVVILDVINAFLLIDLAVIYWILHNSKWAVEIFWLIYLLLIGPATTLPLLYYKIKAIILFFPYKEKELMISKLFFLISIFLGLIFSSIAVHYFRKSKEIKLEYGIEIM
ncbi:hypothetical protein ACXX84_04095 [Mycoplasma sp. AC157]|uniref:hypothetical protein n=1 Tax=Mycoplasma sp. 480 TaxID=3440155 RepID=UPI003F5168CB